jgi:hypothetical protein
MHGMNIKLLKYADVLQVLVITKWQLSGQKNHMKIYTILASHFAEISE